MTDSPRPPAPDDLVAQRYFDALVLARDSDPAPILRIRHTDAAAWAALAAIVLAHEEERARRHPAADQPAQMDLGGRATAPFGTVAAGSPTYLILPPSMKDALIAADVEEGDRDPAGPAHTGPSTLSGPGEATVHPIGDGRPGRRVNPKKKGRKP